MIEFSPMCLKRHQLKVGVSEVEPLVDSLHFDIMDGDFVPTSAFDVDYVDQYESTLPKHVHIMSFYPDSLLDKLSNIMAKEYDLITKSDIQVQLDCPDLALARHMNFKNLSEIAAAKGEIINNIVDNGSIVLNADDKFFDFHKKLAAKKSL